VARGTDRYDLNLSVWAEVLRAELGGTTTMETMRNRERRLAVFALLVIVMAAGIGTLGAVFSGFSFI
jgi:predicted Rossmann-fold nucleotide-binding protein